MGPRIEVVPKVSFQRPSQMPFSEHDHMIQALSANAADETFRERILPRTPCRSEHFLNAHSLNPGSKLATVFPMDSRCAPEWIGPTHLLNYLSHLRIDLRSTDSLTALPSPVKPKALAMPRHHSSRFDNDKTRAPIGPESGQSTQSQRSVIFNRRRTGPFRLRTPSR